MYDPPPDFDEHGPISNPIDRFSHLPENTRKFLEELREDDIKDLIETIKFQRSMKSWARTTKWMILTLLAAALGAANFGEAIMKILGWLKPGGHP